MTSDPKITIDRIDIEDGWVCFRAGESPPPPHLLPMFLERTFTSWLQRNRELKIRETMTIVSEGNTIAIHAWFE